MIPILQLATMIPCRTQCGIVGKKEGRGFQTIGEVGYKNEESDWAQNYFGQLQALLGEGRRGFL